MINAWDFNSTTDLTGHEAVGLSKLSIFKRPVDTLYLVDNEDGPWRPIITDVEGAIFTTTYGRLPIWPTGKRPQARGYTRNAGSPPSDTAARARTSFTWMAMQHLRIPSSSPTMISGRSRGNSLQPCNAALKV